MRTRSFTTAAKIGLMGLVATGTVVAPQASGAGHSAPSVAQPAPGGVDRSEAWLVSPESTYGGSLASGTTRVSTLKDAAGHSFVLSRTTSDKIGGLESLHRGHGAGIVSFSSRAAAESYVRSDASNRSTAATFAAPAIDNGATVNPWLARVDDKKILDTITHLSTAYPNRYYASTTGKTSAEWIRNTWAGLATGRNDVTTQLFTDCSDCSTQPSVMMTVKGSENPDEIVVIGGHLDSISNSGSGNSMKAPGADDDASGIATLTEVIRVALADGWKPKKTVVFAGYAAEEVGLRGSKAMAQSFKAQGKNVVGAMQLDMTNYDGGSTDMNFVGDYTNRSLTQFGKDLFDTYLAPKGLTRGDWNCGYACSDHASWTSAGYPSMMPAESALFDRIHTSSDTLANMGNTAKPSANFAKLALAFLGEMAKTGGATTPTPPSGDVLVNGQARTGLSGATGSWTTFKIDVPAGATGLKFETTGGSGDADLYVKAGSEPTTSVYDCRPYRSGNVETCSFATPRAGTYYVALRGYSAYANLSLKASYATN